MDEVEMRLRALELAGQHDNVTRTSTSEMASPNEIIERARAYLNFLRGDADLIIQGMKLGLVDKETALAALPRFVGDKRKPPEASDAPVGS